MTQAIPAELLNLFPGAKSIGFGDIRKGDTVASFEDGRLIMGVAHAVNIETCWLSKDGRVVAYQDESILLINRPLPGSPGDMIRLSKSLPGQISSATIYVRSHHSVDRWVPAGFNGGTVMTDRDFNGVEWEQVFLTKEQPSE